MAAPEDVILTLLERYNMSGQRAQRLWELELALDFLREQAEMGKYVYTRCEW